jgi:peptide/nickel transport system substrate-binding protein
MVDHKSKLEETVLATLNRRDMIRGMGAGSLAIAAGAMGSGPARAEGGHIKLAWIDHIDTLDPHFTSFFGAIKIHNNIYNGLLKVQYDGKRVTFVPDLAETWTINDDKVHTFKLRPGVKFHDGTPCDAEAVKWSVERVWKGTPKSNHAWKYKELASVDVLDPLTVRLTFNKPYAFLPVALTGSTGRAGTIVSRAAVEKYGANFGRNPVGTGPFKFVSWRENDSVVLEKNPDYFEKGLPKLDKVTMVIMKETSAAVAAMLSGQIDGMSDVPLQFVTQLKAQKNLTVYGEIEGNYVYFGMNTKRAPFDDINLRRAVAYAINREVIIKQAFFGHAQQAYTPISPPMSDFFDPNVATSGRGQRFDLAKAKEFRAKVATKGPIEPIFMASEQGLYGTRMVQSVLPMLEAIDIKPKVELIERAAWVQRLNARDFDMYDYNWWADLDPDETITPEFRTGEAWNYPGWSNKRFDELVTAAQDTLDVSKRQTYYKEACDILMDEAPIGIVAHMPVFKCLSQKVKGFQYIPVDSFNLHTVSLA